MAVTRYYKYVAGGSISKQYHTSLPQGIFPSEISVRLIDTKAARKLLSVYPSFIFMTVHASSEGNH